jgi:hypothetical protein
MAQAAENLPVKSKVLSSNPSTITKNKTVEGITGSQVAWL